MPPCYTAGDTQQTAEKHEKTKQKTYNHPEGKKQKRQKKKKRNKQRNKQKRRARQMNVSKGLNTKGNCFSFSKTCSQKSRLGKVDGLCSRGKVLFIPPAPSAISQVNLSSSQRSKTNQLLLHHAVRTNIHVVAAGTPTPFSD